MQKQQQTGQFDLLLAICYDQTAVMINTPESYQKQFGSIFCEDHDFSGLPKEPGVYRCRVEEQVTLGYNDGYRAPGEDDIEYHILTCTRLDL